MSKIKDIIPNEMSSLRAQDYKIRYNTFSQDDNERWRIIKYDGTEILVSHIDIEVESKTTNDFMADKNEWKWHITARGVLEIKVDPETDYVFASIKEQVI